MIKLQLVLRPTLHKAPFITPPYKRLHLLWNSLAACLDKVIIADPNFA